MTDDLGRGRYEVEADNAGALEAISATDEAFAKSGNEAEAAGQKATGAFQKTGAAAGAIEQPVGRASTAMKVGLTVVGGAAAIATKGILDLDNATAQFTADTGASAEEAERARKSILKMSGDNIQPMEQVGRALGKVHTDLGLTGSAADDTAARFLKFSRVTGQDAAAEVSAFDDILDAWGKTAGDAQGIMDKLVVSHQKYGGAVADDERALASMAPQLRALNLDIDDGISLLNLFKSSGLDAAGIPRALNAAVQNLDGRPLEDFVAELAGIEDPGQRAIRAVEVFGSKAGVQLANAIKPGMTSLGDFAISTEESIGATERARDAIDGTWGNRFQLLMKGAVARITEVGDQFGPLVTGAASLASLGGAMGIDKFIKPFAGKLLEAGKAGGEALIDGIGTATGAAGTVIGNLVANALDPTNPLFGSPIRKVANAGGALWGRTFAVGAKVGEALATVLLALPGVGAVRSAVLAGAIQLGTLQGTTMGKAAGAAFGIAFVGSLALVADQIREPINKLGKDIGDGLRPDFLTDVGKAWADWRTNAQWPLGQKGAPDWLRIGSEVQTGTSMIGGYMAKALRDDAPQVATAARIVTSEIPESVEIANRQAAREAGRIVPAMASALRDKRAGWQAAWDQLKTDASNSMSTTVEMARIKGKLAKIEASRGWRSGDPVWIASLQETRAILQARLGELEGIAKNEGRKGSLGLAGGTRDKVGAVKDAARAVTKAATDAWQTLQNKAGGYGERTGENYAEGIAAGIAHSTYLISTKVQNIQRMLEAGSPPKYRVNPLFGIGRWGYATGLEFPTKMAEGIDAGARLVHAALAGLGGSAGAISRPLVAVGALGGASSSMSSYDQSLTVGDIHVSVAVERLVAADSLAVRDLGRQLGNEVRLSLTRTPTSFVRPAGA